MPESAAVAVFLSRFPSVTETFILREITELERQGQLVRLVPMLREHPPVVHEAAAPWTRRALYTPWLDGRIVRANLATLFTQPGTYLSLLARLIAGTILSPGMLLRTIALFPKSVFIARVLKKESVAHLHAHFATHPTTMALIVHALTGIPFSFTVHAHDIQLDRSLLRWKVRESSFIRSISAFNQRFLEKLYPEAHGRIEVIHVGIEPERYATRGATEERLIVCIAAHKPYKGLPVLIEACGRLRDSGVNFRCEIIGHGPMHDELAAMIAARGLSDSVVLLGPRPEDEVAKIVSRAALFVLPSIIAPDGQMEGIPVALMEAMAAGLPVVSTRISGIPELIDDGVNGLLVEPGDAAALAEAMRRLLADRSTAEAFGRAAREKVAAEFDLRKCTAALLRRIREDSRVARSGAIPSS